jgi:hypothetical protein
MNAFAREPSVCDEPFDKSGLGWVRAASSLVSRMELRLERVMYCIRCRCK